MFSLLFSCSVSLSDCSKTKFEGFLVSSGEYSVLSVVHPPPGTSE